MKTKYKKIIFMLLLIASFGSFIFYCADASRDNEYDPKSSSYVRAVYVSTTGSDGNPGSKEAPLKTIQAGITKALALYGSIPSQVRVAGGTYQSDYRGSTPYTPVINMIENISVYGGYSSNFSARNSTTYETIVQDTSSSGGSLADPNRAVNIGSGLSSATEINGFTIISAGTSGTANASIYNLGSPKISNNTIKGVIPYGGSTFGIISAGGSPFISKNLITTISGGTEAYCLYIDSSTSPMIVNNIILPGSSVGRTYGVYDVNGSDSQIFNNIIDCGKGSAEGFCLFISESSPKISNNILLNIQTNGHARGIYEETANSNPAEVKNNDFYGVNSDNSVYIDFTNGALATVSAMETDLIAESIPTGGNKNDNPNFAATGDGYHLGTSSPSSVISGGIDGSTSGANWGFNDDKDGNTRTGNGTTGWSMGPYEYNN